MSMQQQPTAVTQAPRWMPGQKIWAGGLSFVAAWLLLQLVSNVAAWASIKYGIPIVIPQDQGSLTAVAGAISYIVQYFVPPSVKDVLQQVDTKLAVLAKSDPQVATSLITAASQVPGTKIVTSPAVAAVSPSNVSSNTVSKVADKGAQE